MHLLILHTANSRQSHFIMVKNMGYHVLYKVITAHFGHMRAYMYNTATKNGILQKHVCMYLDGLTSTTHSKVHKKL